MKLLITFLVFLFNILSKGIVVGLLLKRLLLTYLNVDFQIFDGIILVLICNLLFSPGPINVEDENDEGKC